MYAGYSASQPLTNNPFIADGGSNPSARFPDLSSPPVTNQQQQQYGGWGSAAMSPVSPQQQQQGMYQQYSQQQQQPQMTMGYAPQQQMGGGISMGGGGAGYLSPGVQLYPSHTGSGGGGAPFQPSSSFGQQLAAHVSGSSYSYLQGQQQQQGNPNAYNPAQQQLQNPGYVAQLDPYSSIGQLWGDSNQSQPQQQGQAQAQMGGGVGLGQSYSSSAGGVAPLPTGGYGVSASGEPHPRDYIRTHKAEIEAWDNFAWKQLLGAFETLMKAWETRKGELAARVGEMSAQMNVGMAYGPYYVAQIQQEGARLQGLQKEAENNFDSVAASLFQLREVFAGYRQSGDLASKRRVREAMNAALQGLPTFPQPY